MKKEEAQGLPETFRATIAGGEQPLGTFVIFCLGGTTEIKARGLSPEDLKKLLSEISKML